MSNEQAIQQPETTPEADAQHALALNEQRMQNLTVWPQCGATRKKGGQCRAPATAGDGFCPQHSARFTDADRRRWGAAGADATNHRRLAEKLASLPIAQQEALLQLPDLNDAAAVMAVLAKTFAEVRQGLLPPAQARVLNELLATRLKMVELDQAARLLALEARLQERS